MSTAIRRTVSLQEAVYWLNIQLELLAADQQALRRMKDVLKVQGNGSGAFELDVELLLIETERVLTRLSHWEGVVARIRSSRRKERQRGIATR